MDTLNKFFVAGTLVAMLAVGGCATVLDSGPDAVPVTSNPPGATCVVAGQTVVTPGTVTLQHTHNVDYDVRCSKDGYADAYGKIVSKINPAFAGSLFFFPAAAIDVATGNDYHYPNGVDVVLAPVQASN